MRTLWARWQRSWAYAKTQAWTGRDRERFGALLRVVSIVFRTYAMGSLFGIWLDHSADLATVRARIVIVLIMTAVGYAFLAADMKLRPVVRRWI